MARQRKAPARSGETDAAIHEQLNEVARRLVARGGEHFEGVAIIATYRDSKGRQRGIVWTDGNEYTAYAAAKDFVICAEERMRKGTFAPGMIDDDHEPA